MACCIFGSQPSHGYAIEDDTWVRIWVFHNGVYMIICYWFRVSKGIWEEGCSFRWGHTFCRKILDDRYFHTDFGRSWIEQNVQCRVRVPGFSVFVGVGARIH